MSKAAYWEQQHKQRILEFEDLQVGGTANRVKQCTERTVVACAQSTRGVEGRVQCMCAEQTHVVDRMYCMHMGGRN